LPSARDCSAKLKIITMDEGLIYNIGSKKVGYLGGK
jgi:hypothetical protein